MSADGLIEGVEFTGAPKTMVFLERGARVLG